MANRVYLSEPTERLQEQYLLFYNEWIFSGESIVPWVVRKQPEPFHEYIRFLNEAADETNVSPGLVPHSTYWLVNDRDVVLGAANIRHRLNERLLQSGGHIGYGIRPSERRKGYASQMLALALERLRSLGVSEALLVCDKENIGSEKTIVKNGGVLESEFTEDNGNIVKRFWVKH